MKSSQFLAIPWNDRLLIIAVFFGVALFAVGYAQWMLYRTAILPGEECVRNLDADCAFAELQDPDPWYRSYVLTSEWFWALRYINGEGSLSDRLHDMIRSDITRIRGRTQLEAIAEVSKILNSLDGADPARAYFSAVHETIEEIQPNFNPIIELRISLSNYPPYCHNEQALQEMLGVPSYRSELLNVYNLHPCLLKYFAHAPIEQSDVADFIEMNLRNLREQRLLYGEYRHNLGLNPFPTKGAPTGQYVNVIAYLATLLTYRENHPDVDLFSI